MSRRTLCEGEVAPGFEPVRRAFAEELARGAEVGAALAVYAQGKRVVHLWGGVADVQTQEPFLASTPVLVFSVTKGLVAMAFALLFDRGLLEPETLVADVWPGFAKHGKTRIRVADLLNHRAGLPVLETKLSLDDVTDPSRAQWVASVLEDAAPLWPVGEHQAYHATTFGLFAREIFERVAHEPLGAFLQRELFGPLQADVRLGTARKLATLYPPSLSKRLSTFTQSLFERPHSPEARIFKRVLRGDKLVLGAFLNPALGRQGMHALTTPKALSAGLAWAGATATADGLARAYLPFAMGGSFEGRRFLHTKTLSRLYDRQSFSQRDCVLQKPLGFSLGFVKDELHLFSPERAAFGHPGIGGALGFCDPVRQLTIGYVMNRLDWRVRSRRALKYCHALYASAPLCGLAV